LARVAVRAARAEMEGADEQEAMGSPEVAERAAGLAGLEKAAAMATVAELAGPARQAVRTDVAASLVATAAPAQKAAPR
jgi:hypothetical protein